MAQELRHVKPSPLALGCLMAAWAVHHFDVHYARHAKYVSDHSIFHCRQGNQLGGCPSLDRTDGRPLPRASPHRIRGDQSQLLKGRRLSSRNTSLADFNWQEIEFEGTTPHEFDAQISELLQPILSTGWRTQTSEKHCDPLCVKPSALLVYRKGHCFGLDSVISR